MQTHNMPAGIQWRANHSVQYRQLQLIILFTSKATQRTFLLNASELFNASAIIFPGLCQSLYHKATAGFSSRVMATAAASVAHWRSCIAVLQETKGIKTWEVSTLLIAVRHWPCPPDGHEYIFLGTSQMTSATLFVINSFFSVAWYQGLLHR